MRSEFHLFTFLLLSLALNSQLADQASKPQNSSPALNQSTNYASREGRVVKLHPSGATFQIPKDWIEWDPKSHGNLRLNKLEILKTKEPRDTWDSSYADVVDAALPLDNCVAHLGDEGWGSEGVSWTGLQMRAYMLDQKAERARQQILKRGSAAAEQVSAGAMTWNDKVTSWQRVSIQYNNSSGQRDFSAFVLVEFYIRPLERGTAVLVFMHARGYQDETIKSILDSVAVKP